VGGEVIVGTLEVEGSVDGAILIHEGFMDGPPDGEGVGGSMRNFPYTSTSAKLKIPPCVSRDVPLIRTI